MAINGELKKISQSFPSPKDYIRPLCSLHAACRALTLTMDHLAASGEVQDSIRNASTATCGVSTPIGCPLFSLPKRQALFQRRVTKHEC